MKNDEFLTRRAYIRGWNDAIDRVNMVLRDFAILCGHWDEGDEGDEGDDLLQECCSSATPAGDDASQLAEGELTEGDEGSVLLQECCSPATPAGGLASEEGEELEEGDLSARQQ
ncbi:MAG: hypothetical protein ACSW8J_02890 [bacterium]